MKFIYNLTDPKHLKNCVNMCLWQIHKKKQVKYTIVIMTIILLFIIKENDVKSWHVRPSV